MEKNNKKKLPRTKNFLKRLALAGLITASFTLLYNQFDTKLIKALSKNKEYVVGVDFEAYNQTEQLGINLPNKEGEETEDLANMEIENWVVFSSYAVSSWVDQFYSNTFGFSPYLSQKKDANQTLEQGDINLKASISYTKKSSLTVVRIRGDEEEYECLLKEDPLTFLTKRIVRMISDYDYKMIIELEAPDDGDSEAHNKRIEIVKKANPELRVATTLDKNEGYDEETGLWDPEKGKEYWQNSDIIILEDYFSTPSALEQSLINFKKATRNKKQIWVRVVTGTRRINERKINTLEQELEEYVQLMEVAKEYADGCLANDWNGIWLFSDNAYDDRERFDVTKDLYKKFRRIKLDTS